MKMKGIIYCDGGLQPSVRRVYNRRNGKEGED